MSSQITTFGRHVSLSRKPFWGACYFLSEDAGYLLPPTSDVEQHAQDNMMYDLDAPPVV